MNGDRSINDKMNEYFEKWEYEDNYIGEDYSDYFVIFSRSRDSEYLEESNFESILRIFEDNHIEESEDIYLVIRNNHWLVGWIEFILVYKDASDKIKEVCIDIGKRLDDYPVLDDEDFYEREDDIINESIENYIYDEFIDKIAKKFNLYDISIKDNVELENIYQWIKHLGYNTRNCEFIIENGAASLYGIDNIISNLDIDDVKEYFDIEYIGEKDEE